jgi:hypothetical protein
MHDRSNTHRKDRRSFVLTLRSEPNVDAIRSLRRALKTLLRRDGLKCIGIHESTADGREGPTQNKATPIPSEATLAPGEGHCVTGEPSIRSRS